jgi:hypothetical protein
VAVVEHAAGERAVAQAHRHALGLDAVEPGRRQLGDHHADRIGSGVDRGERGAVGHGDESLAASGITGARVVAGRSRRAITGTRYASGRMPGASRPVDATYSS